MGINCLILFLKMNLQSIKEIEIKFETAAEVPPPFCHYYHLKFKSENDKWFCSFEWKYHNRGELTIEEINDEGFTENDDFDWKGEINNKLVDEIINKFSKINLFPEKENIPPNQNYLHISIINFKEIVLEGTPKVQHEYEYFLQEVIQGIYELSGKERPLEINYVRNLPGAKFEKIKLQVNFSVREVNVSVKTDIKADFLNTIIPWLQGQEIINRVFNLDFDADSDDLLYDEPSQTGVFIETGNGIWYEMGKSVKSFSKKRDDLLQVEKIFSNLIR